MALPATTITLNVGSPAADRVYTRQESPTPGVAVYHAPSPNGDLAGQSVLTVRHNRSSAGLMQTILQFKRPIQNAVTGKYDSYLQADVKVTRFDTATLASVDEILEEAQEVLAVSGVRSALGQASY